MNEPSLNELRKLMPKIVLVAQKVYDEWQQDESGYDEEYGGGGICHEIAEKVAEVLLQNNIEANTVSQTIGDVHVYVVAKFKEGVYSIDIPPSIYEIGSAYTWKKKPNIKFNQNHIAIDLIDKNPEKFEDYLEQTQTFKQWLKKSNFIVRRKWPSRLIF